MHSSKIVPIMVVLLGMTLSALEPALAGNKFEIISTGVAGSSRLKSEYIQIFFVVFGAVMLLSSVLCITMPHNNAHHLNFTGWKQSAVITFLASIGFFTAARAI